MLAEIVTENGGLFPLYKSTNRLENEILTQAFTFSALARRKNNSALQEPEFLEYYA